MNLIISNTILPTEIIVLIFDLVIDIKTKNLDFDVLLSLLKVWHNKKLIRELIYSLSYSINVMNKSEIVDCSFFITNLLEINEIGLASVFYNMLRLSIKTEDSKFKSNIHDNIIEDCMDMNLFDQLFKIIDQNQLYFLYSTRNKNPSIEDFFLKTAIKLEKHIFLVLYCYNKKIEPENKYRDIAEDLIKNYNEHEKYKIWDDNIRKILYSKK